MVSLKIRLSMPKAISLVMSCSVFAFFCLLIGVAELRHPDVPAAYLAAHPSRITIGCIVDILIGLVLVLVAVAGVRGSLLDRPGVLDAKQAATFTRGRWLH
jgi:Na+/pantothenate symporter